MKAFQVTIYERADDLPALDSPSLFHSQWLMRLCEQTPRQKPYMAVATDGDGAVRAHLLAIARRRWSWLPPYLYTHVRVLGEGDYADPDDRQELFSLLLRKLTRRLQSQVLYIEVSHLSQKMFGYRSLRAEGFFPVRWMSIHNSLHSRTPEERILPRQLRRVERARQRGAVTTVVETDDDFSQFMRLIRRHNYTKLRKYIPHERFFRGIMTSGNGRLYITRYHDRTIGCAAVVFSQQNAYLWFTASRRKSFAPLHPNAVTVWAALKDAHALGLQHMTFLDVGLPFRKNPYRDFILRFGGKEVSTYRWFRISIRWVNAFASWLWRE